MQGASRSKNESRIRPPQPAPQHRATFGIDAVDLKDGLGEIEADDGDSHGWLPKLIETTLHSNVAAEAVHAIKWAVQRSRYMTLETIAPVPDDPIIGLPLAD